MLRISQSHISSRLGSQFGSSLWRRPLSLGAWFEESILQRPNPFLHYVAEGRNKQADVKSMDEITERKDPGLEHLPPWNALQPHHATKATATILDHFRQNILTLQPSPELSSLRDLKQRWKDIRAPVLYLQQSLSVLALAADPPSARVQWQSSHQTFLQTYASIWQEQIVQNENDKIANLFELNIPSDATAQDCRWLRYWQTQTGTSLTSRRDEWRRWQTALADIRQAWPTTKPQQSRTWLPLLYSYVGCTQTLARNVWDAQDAAHHALAVRGYLGSEDDHVSYNSKMSALHEAVRAQVTPHLMMMASEVTSTPLVAQATPIKNLRKERIISLDAVLLVMEKLCLDVFDVQLHWHSQKFDSWQPDVRLLHLSSNDIYLGSVYFDFFARPDKSRASVTVPVTGTTSVVSLQLEAPTWDTDPVYLSWENLLDFFHEMGHVLQLSIAPSDPSWPSDWAEVLPKFMEHWLWEPTTMKSLLVASGVEFDDETLQVLYRQAKRHKADELAHQAFYSAMEWELFSTYDLQKADETIMAVAQRLARQYIPHDVPHSTDFTALYQMANANIMDGESVALYRYLWAEVAAATLFEKVKASYESQQGLPKAALLQHLCRPTDWVSFCDAFELSSKESLPLDSMWKRYKLD